jgi:hypothetical protein
MSLTRLKAVAAVGRLDMPGGQKSLAQMCDWLERALPAAAALGKRCNPTCKRSVGAEPSSLATTLLPLSWQRLYQGSRDAIYRAVCRMVLSQGGAFVGENGFLRQQEKFL